MKKFALAILVSLTLFSCNSNPIKDMELHNLVALMLGEFSNEEQAKKDPSFTLHNFVSARIWKDRPGYWVYTEVFDTLQDHFVYSQRISKYERADSSRIKSTNYKIPNAKDYVTAWKDPVLFNKLTIDSLQLLDGCEVYFKKKTSTIYSGKTNKDHCKSDMKSIDYFSSTFVISKHKISIWTRGYNKEGKHVFGKIKGPYKYKKQNSR